LGSEAGTDAFDGGEVAADVFGFVTENAHEEVLGQVEEGGLESL